MSSKPSSFQQSWFSTLQLPCSSPLIGCTRTTPFFRWQAETQHAWRPLTCQQRVFCKWHSVSHKGGKSVLLMKETLWGAGLNLNFVKDVHMICANFITNIIIVAEGEEKKRGGDITFIPPLVHISYCIHHLIHSHKASNKYKSYGLVNRTRWSCGHRLKLQQERIMWLNIIPEQRVTKVSELDNSHANTTA